MDAIDQLFAEFELMYHNQYNKAFHSAEKLTYAKRLWYDHLKPYSANTILAAAKIATRQSEFLPTVATMVTACEARLDEASGLPSLRSAYREACLAPAPRNAYAWSHPVVYLAGRDSGWLFLHETAERYALPVFSEHYRKWRQRYQAGEQLPLPEPTQTTEAPAPRLDKNTQLKHLQKLRQSLGL